MTTTPRHRPSPGAVGAPRGGHRRALLAAVLAVARLACAEALCTNVTVTIHTGHGWVDHGNYWQVDGGAEQGRGYADKHCPGHRAPPRYVEGLTDAVLISAAPADPHTLPVTKATPNPTDSREEAAATAMG